MKNLLLAGVVLGVASGFTGTKTTFGGGSTHSRQRVGQRRMTPVEEFSISREIKNIRVFEGDFADDICEAVAYEAVQTIAEKGLFSMAIPSGSVVAALSRLDTAELDVEKIHVFFANEKLGEETSNYDEAVAGFVTAKGIPLENVHKVPYSEEDGAEAAAAQYAELLATHPSVDNAGPLPSVDMVLLGTGADGHCGMLFPDSPEIKQTGLGKVVLPVEGQNAVAMSMDAFCAAKVALVSAAGAARADMVCRALSGKYGDWDCPAGMVDAAGETIWFCDEDSIAKFNDEEVSQKALFRRRLLWSVAFHSSCVDFFRRLSSVYCGASEL